jgi:hypothetical protein
MQKHIALAAALTLLPATAFAGTGNSTTKKGNSTAQAIAPLTLVHNAGFSLNFGRFTVGSSGTVSVPNTGGASTSGGVTFIGASTTALDRFTAFGDSNRLIAITTGNGTVTAGANVMSFTTTPMLPAGYIPAGGSGYFTVGGTLSVNAGQAPGSYAGSYTVNVNYN